MDIDNQSGDGTVSAVLVPGASAKGMSTTLGLDTQMGNANGADWKEEVYQKIKSMREKYLPELNDEYQKIASKVQQHDSLPQCPQNEQIEKLKMFKMMLEHVVLFLRLNKHDIQLTHKEKLPTVEKQISFFLSGRPGKPTSSPLQGQLPQSSMQLHGLHEQQMLQNQQLRHMQQRPSPLQQLFHMLFQQQQQTVELRAHQMSQLHQMTDDATTYETISGPEDSDKEEDDGDVSKEDGLEEVAVTEEQKSAVKVGENKISCGLNSGAKLDERLAQVEERLGKMEDHSEKVKTQDAKVSRDIKRPAKYVSSSWSGNDEMIRQSCKHRRFGRDDKAVIHPVALRDDCAKNDQMKLDDEEEKFDDNYFM